LCALWRVCQANGALDRKFALRDLFAPRFPLNTWGKTRVS